VAQAASSARTSPQVAARRLHAADGIGAHAVNRACIKTSVDTERDFAPISLVAASSYILVVHPSLPVRSVRELITFAKQHRGQINYASTGSGGATHLAAEMLKSMTGANITHVPYKGTAQAVNDVVGGQIPSCSAT
jgi:tripartite-type tricarboxylate transporter receptor subunit TctC